jgi:hypothetical protein
MNPRLYVSIIDAAALLIFFVVNPLLFFAIGYFAWKGKPNTFDRRKYGVVAFATLPLGLVLVICMKLINADVRTWQYVPQVVCMLLGLLLVGIGCGCATGFLTYQANIYPNPVKIICRRLLELFGGVTFLLLLHPIL